MMEQEHQAAPTVNSAYLEALATNPHFIDAIVRRLAGQSMVYKIGKE